ncbi:MAG: HIT family protein, partial [Betaproteobacteria bacterium]
MACDLCDGDGGEVLFRDAKLRVVAVTGAEAVYRGFCRVIWNAHTKEITDLTRDDRNRFMDAVYRLETALRSSLDPDKMNIASLGNMTPHLHWHVIPRFHDDATFP